MKLLPPLPLSPSLHLPPPLWDHTVKSSTSWRLKGSGDTDSCSELLQITFSFCVRQSKHKKWARWAGKFYSWELCIGHTAFVYIPVMLEVVPSEFIPRRPAKVKSIGMLSFTSEVPWLHIEDEAKELAFSGYLPGWYHKKWFNSHNLMAVSRSVVSTPCIAEPKVLLFPLHRQGHKDQETLVRETEQAGREYKWENPKYEAQILWFQSSAGKKKSPFLVLCLLKVSSEQQMTAPDSGYFVVPQSTDTGRNNFRVLIQQHIRSSGLETLKSHHSHDSHHSHGDTPWPHPKYHTEIEDPLKIIPTMRAANVLSVALM